MDKITITDLQMQSLPFWNDLSPQEQSLIWERHYLTRYAKGDMVCGGHHNCLGMIVLCKGVIRTYLLSPEGKEVTLYRIRKGEACVMAAACVLRSISFATHVEAQTDCSVLIIPVDVFASLMRTNPYVRAASYETATKRFSEVVSAFEQLVFMNLEQRLCAFLLKECEAENSHTLFMTHEQIASSIGSAREAVGRILKKMESRQLVELFRGGIRVLDTHEMQQQIFAYSQGELLDK